MTDRQSLRNIILIGSMGAGKSTVGRLLARALQWRFVDSDAAIVERTKVDVATIFSIEGEAGFRRREARMLETLCAENHLVLATGGGAVLQEVNRQLLRRSGCVVYLQAPAAKLASRLQSSTGRPLLDQVQDKQAHIQALLDEREPLYLSTAHVVVYAGDGVSKTVHRVMEAVRHVTNTAG